MKAALPNTQKQTQGGCQIEEAKKYGPNERTEQNPREGTKQKGDSQPIRTEFKTLIIRMLRELNQYNKKNKGRNEG